MEQEIKISTTNNKLHFGFSQIFHPTPKTAKTIAKTILYFVAIINGVLAFISEVPQHIKDVIARYSIEIVSVIHFICQMFGVKISEVDVKKTDSE